MTQTNRIILRVLFLILLAAVPLMAASAQAPTVNSDAYSVNVNGYLNVAAGSGLLVNDTGFNATTHRLETFDSVSQYGGTVFVASDGAFTYDPPIAFRGVDTFAYTVRNASGSNRAIVTIDVTGETVWFVDDTAAAGGDGTINAPFNSFAPVNGSGGVGDIDSVGNTIFVYEGSYSVEFDLESGQKLIGHSEGLDLIGTANDVAAATTPALTTSGSFPIVELFGAGGAVRGFAINNTNSQAISGTSISNFTIANVAITAGITSSGAVAFIGTSGTNTLNNVDITGTVPSGNSAFAFVSNAGTINLVGSTVSSFTGGRVLSIDSNSGTIAFDANSDLSSTDTRGLIIASQTATGVVTLAGVDLDGGVTGNPLISLLNNHANSVVNFEEGVFADAATTNTQAFNHNGGKLKIAGTTSVLTAASGSALDLEGVELTQNATFASLSSTDSTSEGVRISQPVGNNDIIVTGTTTVTNPATRAVRANSTAASGFLLQMAVLNSTGGTVGIEVLNTAVTVTNSTSTLTTSAGPAVFCTTGTTNLALATLTAAGGTTGVSFDGCTGTVTATVGTLNSTGGATNHVVNIVNTSGTSAVSFTYGGTINKTTDGAAVNIVGLTGAAGAASFNGTVTGTNASDGVLITNTTRPVTFTTLTLGTGGARFTVTPVTLAGNTGAVDLGVFTSFTDGDEALTVSYANASPGAVTTDAGSVLNTTGASAALFVSHATSQAITLSFASITNTGAGSHGISLNRTSGAIVVSGLTNLGAKTTAGIEISNSNTVASFQEVDINGAADGVKLSNNNGSFTILGDGNFATSHTDGFGGTFTNLTDNAFDFNGVVDFRATDLTISGTGGHGVTGRSVSGTTIFSNVDMTNIGNADNEHVFNFQEGAVSGAQVSGTLNINNSVITNFTDNGLYLENFAGALNFRFTDNTLTNNITTAACGGGNCNGNGILLRADGTATITGLIQNNNINQVDGIAITANPEGNSNARMDLTIRQNTIVANAYGGASHTNNGEIAISLRNAQGNSDLYFDVDDNDFDNYSGEFALAIVEVEGGDTTTTHGRINNNQFLDAHFGSPIGLNPDGGHTSGPGTPTNFDFIVSVTTNTGPGSMYGAGIYAVGYGGIAGSNPNAQITLTGNTFNAVPSGVFQRTLMVDFGGFNRGCFNITGNTLAAGNGGSNGLDFYYQDNVIMQLQGTTGSTDALATTRLTSTNTVAGGVFVGVLNNITSATCTTPTMPNPVP